MPSYIIYQKVLLTSVRTLYLNSKLFANRFNNICPCKPSKNKYTLLFNMYVNVVNATRLKTQVPVTVLVFVYHVLGKYSSKVKQEIVFSKATEIHLQNKCMK